jgi:hypothetical protein
MFRRTCFTLLVAPLLAVSLSCSGGVDTSSQQPPPTPTNGETASGAQQSIESPSEVEGAPIIGLSSRTTPDHIWAEPVIDGGAVSIPLAVTTMGDHFHFEVPGPSGPMGFIAYQVDGAFHIRAAHCPGCGGKDIDYVAGVLACPDCGSTFSPSTGAGLGVNWGYPEGSIPASVSDGFLTSLRHSLTVAYDRTVSGEETLYKGPATPQGTGGGGCSSCG